jgi:chemotaxis protein CheD
MYWTGYQMYSIKNIKFNKKELILHPGDYFCSDEDIIMSTILGSCISVVLYDESKQQGGLNHFLLPRIGRVSNTDIIEEKSARYGVHAMEILINNIMKMGSEKSSLIAKVFGGASMFGPMNREHGVGYINTQFALQFLSKEGIPIIATNTGENVGRKIFFFPRTGKVLMRKIHSKRKLQDIRERDEGLQQSILEKPVGDKIVLF